MKKFFSFVKKFYFYNIVWFGSTFLCLYLLTVFHPNEETISLNEFEALVLFVSPIAVCIALGRKVFHKESRKRESKLKAAIVKLFSRPKREHIIEPVIQPKPVIEQNIEASSEPTPEPAIIYRPIERERFAPDSIAPEYAMESVDTMDGHEFEYWCAELFRKNGFVDVSVTRGSGDQGVDVLAKKDGIKYAVQCKCYSKDLGNTPVQEVNAGKVFYNCQIGAVITNRHFTSGAKQLAAATGVLLWDRDWILSHLSERQSEAVPINSNKSDCLIWDAWYVIKETGIASVSVLQRRLSIGYARASRIMDELEELGYVGPFRGSSPREILK